jgi:hypothetical protein
VPVYAIKDLSHQINRVSAPIAQRTCQILNGADRHIRPPFIHHLLGAFPRIAQRLSCQKSTEFVDMPRQTDPKRIEVAVFFRCCKRLNLLV